MKDNPRQNQKKDKPLQESLNSGSEERFINKKNSNTDPIIIDQREKYYESIINDIKQNDYCLQSKDSIYKKKYERKYGFFCYSCTNEDMCEYCFFNCHKNCDEKLKIIAKLNENITNTKYYCSCKTNLFHSIRKPNPLKEKITKQFTKFDKVYSNIFKDEETEHYFSTKSHNLINNIITNLRQSSTLTRKNSKILKQEKNMLYQFNKCFNDFFPENDDYLEFYNIFILYQHIIGQQLMENYFGKFKPLKTNDFIAGTYLDILWYKKLLKKKMEYHFEKYQSNFFQPENSRETKYNGEILLNYVLSQIYLYLTITTNIAEKLCKFMCNNIQKSKVHLEEEDELKEMIQIICKNINILVKYLVVDDKRNSIILNFLFMMNVYLSKCNKVTCEKKDNISYINGFPFLLSSLLYKCVQTYNLKILEDYIKYGNSDRKYMFFDTHEEIKNKCIISFIKLIANKDNNPITFDKEIELQMLDDLFFSPFNKNKGYLNMELLSEFNFEKLDYKLIEEYYEINNNIHKFLGKLFVSNSHEFYINKILYKTTNEKKLIDESEDENADIEELEKIIKELYDKIEILTMIKNPVVFLSEIKNQTKLRVFYNILYDELFIDEYDEELINEVVDYLIYNNIDYSIALTLSVLFNIFIKNEKVKDKQFLKKFENILNYSLNILTIISCNEKGLRAMSIGSTLQIISNIIFGTNTDISNLDFTTKMKKDIFFKKMYIKVYKFYSIIPLHLRKDYLKQIKPEIIWTDPIINILTIYKGIIKKDEINHLKDSQNILELYYSFMQIHENYFNIKDCVSFIENNYNNKNNYNQIKLSDEKFKQSEIYFDLLELISYNHSMIAKNEQPSKNFLHLLKMEQFTEIMQYKYLPFSKKIILLKSMFLIIIAPFKDYMPTKREKTNKIKECLLPLIDEFLLVLINEIQKLEKLNEYSYEEKNYYIQVLSCIWDFCSFIYSSNNLSDYLLKNYYILLLKLKSKKPILDMMLLNIKDESDSNKVTNFIDKEEFEKKNNELNRICFSYDVIYKNYYTFFLKYEKFIPSLYNANLSTNFFSIMKSNISYSKINIRYKFLFQNNFIDNINRYNKIKYNESLMKNINNWIDSTIEQIQQTDNYVCSNIIHSNIQKKINFEYLLGENLSLGLFNLLNVSGELSSIMILKIGYEVIYNISTDDLNNAPTSDKIENTNTKSSIYLENLISELLNKLFFFLKSYISVSKIYPNTNIEKEICIRVIGLIKLFQYFLEGFNCTFIYYIFIKKYQLKIEQENFDKEFTYGFPEQIDNSNYFQNDKNSEKQEISENTQELIKKNYHYRNPPFNPKVLSYTMFSSFFRIGFRDIESPKPLFLQLIPIFDLSMDTINKIKNIKPNSVVLSPDSNYALIFSCLIDFYIKCVSNFSIGTKKIFSNSFVFYTAEYVKYESGIFNIFSNMTQKTTNNYLNLKVFSKIRILDLVYSLMDHKYFKLYTIYKEIDNINLSNLGFKYYEMILFYFESVLDRNLKEGIFSKELTQSIIRMKSTKKMQKYCNILESIYIEYNKFRECMEFELIIKLFNFINILEYDYNYDFISKHFKQLEETGLYDINKFNIYSPIAYILYLFLKKVCLVIPINFVIPEKCKSNVNEIKIYDEKFLDETENYKYQKESVYLGHYRSKMKQLEENEIISPITKEEMNKTEDEDEQKYIYFIRPILTFHIKEDEINSLITELDHSSHESKTHSLMEAIDYYCLYMNLKECNKKTDFHINLYIIEIINNVLYFVLNIFLLSVYYVGYNASDEEYNTSIWNRTKEEYSLAQIILVILHIVFCVIVLILFWVYEILYTVSKEVSQISNSSFIFNYKETSNEEEKNQNDDLARLRKKAIVENLQYNHKINMNQLKFIEEIYNDLSKLKIYSICFQVFVIPNKTISFIFWSLIFDIIYCITDFPIFVVIPLLFVANLISTVKDTLTGLRIQWKSITFTFGFELFLLFVFMWIAFLFFPEQFQEEAKTADGEDIDGEEPFCNSSFQCFMFFISQGLFDDGTHEMIGNISFRKSPGFFVGMFFYNMIAFLIIGVIASNIFTGLISDAFSEFRQITVDKNESLDNQCFICDLSRDDCENGGENFDYHRNNVHNVSRYFYFLCYLYTKNQDDFTSQEKTIWDCILTHDNSWIPHDKN